LPAWAGERPSRSRVNTTRLMSKIGSPSTSTGTAQVEMLGGVLKRSLIARMASTKPSTWLPMSPMKMLAGLKLKIKKPSAAPVIAAARLETSPCPSPADRMKKKAAAIPVRPAARPSMLSRKLRALVRATIQISVRAPSSSGTWNSVILMPARITTSAATTCARNLIRKSMPCRSSIRPIRAIHDAPAPMASVSTR